MMKKITIVLALCTIVVDHSFAFIPHLRMAARSRAQQRNTENTQEKHMEPTCENIFVWCIAYKDAQTVAEANVIRDKIGSLLDRGAMQNCLKDPLYWLTGIDDYIKNEPNAPGVAQAKKAMLHLGELIIQKKDEAQNKTVNN